MILKPKDMAKRLGVSVQTLQHWGNDGTLKAYRNPKNRRYYTEEQYLEYIGESKKNDRKHIAYCRVSNRNQQDDLENQIGFIKQYTNTKGNS